MGVSISFRRSELFVVEINDIHKNVVGIFCLYVARLQYHESERDSFRAMQRGIAQSSFVLRLRLLPSFRVGKLAIHVVEYLLKKSLE